MSRWGFGLTKEEVRDIIQAYVKENDVTTPFTDQVDNDWYLNFQKRHHLTVKKPETHSSSLISTNSAKTKWIDGT